MTMENFKILYHEDKKYEIGLVLYPTLRDGCLIHQGEDDVIFDDNQLRKFYEILKERYA